MNDIIAVEAPKGLGEMTTGSTPLPICPQSISDCWKFAKLMIKSGLAPTVRVNNKDMPMATETVTAIILNGLELGVGPFEAMKWSYVVHGKVAIFGQLPLKLARRSGLIDYHIEGVEGEGADMVAYCEIKRVDQEQPYRSEFSMKDAKDAGLSSGHMYKKYPKRMLIARARGFALQGAVPEALSGAYVVEEGDVENARHQHQPRVTEQPSTEATQDDFEKMMTVEVVEGEVVEDTEEQEVPA